MQLEKVGDKMEFKYVDDALHAVEELMYQSHFHIRIDRDRSNHVWVISYED